MRTSAARRRPLAVALGVGLVASALGLLPCFGQQVHRNGFEGRTTSWVRAGADAPFEEIAHAVTDQGAHEGQRAEYLHIKAGQGSHVYYQYPCGRAAIGEELSASV